MGLATVRVGKSGLILNMPEIRSVSSSCVLYALCNSLVGFAKFKMVLLCRKFFTLSSDVTECSFGAQVGADKCVIHYCMQVVSGIERNFELTKYFGLME